MKKNEYLYAVVTIMLAAVIFFTTTLTVLSQSRDRQRKQYYVCAEKMYLNQVRDILDGEGYEHGGVTVRWVEEADGMRNYTVLIHHKKINSLDVDGRDKLLEILSKVGFADQNCSFKYEFI